MLLTASSRADASFSPSVFAFYEVSGSDPVWA